MLPRELIKKVKRIELITRRLVNPELAGAYHSTFKGRGMDFDEVQPYVAGDDVRFIDWNVTARTGNLYIKRFVEERELTVQILVDTSSSMEFGSGAERKRLVAAQVAMVLAVLAIKNNDRVGLLLFDREVEHYFPPKKGKKHVLNLVTQVAGHKPRGAQTDIAEALRYLTRVTKRRAVVFVVSDFLTGGYEDALSIVARRHDVIPVLIEDLRERTLDPRHPDQGWGWLKKMLFGGGVLSIEDLESGRRARFDLGSRRHHEVFASRVAAAAVARRRIFNRLRLDTIHFALEPGIDGRVAETEYVKPLAAFFRRRARRH